MQHKKSSSTLSIYLSYYTLQLSAFHPLDVQMEDTVLLLATALAQQAGKEQDAMKVNGCIYQCMHSSLECQ